MVSLISQLSHSLSADHLQLCEPFDGIAGDPGPIAFAGTLPASVSVVANGLSAIVSGPGFGGAISSALGGAPIGLPASASFAASPLTDPPLGGFAFFSCACAPATTNAPNTAPHCSSFFIVPSGRPNAGARRL